MKLKIKKELAKETIAIVGSAILVNYPLSVLVTWILIDVLMLTNAIVIATVVTFFLTLTGVIRVYWIRYRFHKTQELKKDASKD